MVKKFFLQPTTLLLMMAIVIIGCGEYANYEGDSSVITGPDDDSTGKENQPDDTNTEGRGTLNSDGKSRINLQQAQISVNISPVWLEKGDTWVQVVTSLPSTKDPLVVLLNTAYWIHKEDEFPFLTEQIPVTIPERGHKSEKMFVRQFPGVTTVVTIQSLEELKKLPLPT